jgi:hypothetical protein
MNYKFKPNFLQPRCGHCGQFKGIIKDHTCEVSGLTIRPIISVVMDAWKERLNAQISAQMSQVRSVHKDGPSGICTAEQVLRSPGNSNTVGGGQDNRGRRPFMGSDESNGTSER